MRIRTLTLAALMTVSALATALPASAGTVCYDLDVVVNGDAVVDESACEELPL